MRLIRTDKVPDGSTLGRDIITGRDAVPLLRAGVSIDQRYRDALQKAGIYAIYIADEHSEGILPVPAISDEARLLTTRAVSAAFDEAKRSIAAGKSLPTAAANSLTQVVERILLEIEETDVASLVLNNNACADAYIVQHAIDVTSLGLIMGRRLMGEQGWTDHRGQRYTASATSGWPASGWDCCCTTSASCDPRRDLAQARQVDRLRLGGHENPSPGGT